VLLFLSRALLGPLVVVPPVDVTEAFWGALYALLEALIAAPLESDAEMTESRLGASVLLCRAFMRFEMNDNMTVLDITGRWMQVLDYLELLMQVDQSDQLVCHCLLFSKREIRGVDEWAVLSSSKQCPSRSRM
jgi:brefeldin A-resistance guanine nucleotide exchange factor 1